MIGKRRGSMVCLKGERATGVYAVRMTTHAGTPASLSFSYTNLLLFFLLRRHVQRRRASCRRVAGHQQSAIRVIPTGHKKTSVGRVSTMPVKSKAMSSWTSFSGHSDREPTSIDAAHGRLIVLFRPLFLRSIGTVIPDFLL